MWKGERVSWRSNKSGWLHTYTRADTDSVFMLGLTSLSRDAPSAPHLNAYLPELHDQVHEGGRGAVGLLGRAHGGLQQILDGDLVPQSLVEQPLPQRQLAVGQDLNLQRGIGTCVGTKLRDRLTFRRTQTSSGLLFFSWTSERELTRSSCERRRISDPVFYISTSSLDKDIKCIYTGLTPVWFS